MDVTSLDTPFATVDLNAVERNIERIQGYCGKHGLDFRPHIKTHKLPAIAHLQVRAGAVGITCQKLGEAEVMEAAGLRDILLTFPLVGAARPSGSRRSRARQPSSVVGDSDVVASGLSPALARAGIEVGFLVECDTGFRRTGVQTPEAAADLAELVALAARPALRRADDLSDAARDGAVAPCGDRRDPSARAGSRTGQRGRDADVLLQPRGAAR